MTAPGTAREEYQAMEFSVTKSALLSGLNTTQGVVERKTTIPILSSSRAGLPPLWTSAFHGATDNAINQLTRQDRGIQAMIEIYKGVRLPEPVANFFTRNQLAGMLQKQT